MDFAFLTGGSALKHSLFALRRAAIAAGMFALLVAAPLLPGAPKTIGIADYRGTDDVLLTAAGETITQRELFLYAVETNAVDPLLVKEWRNQPPERRLQLRAALDEYLKARLFAARAEKKETATEIELEVRAARLYAAGAARMIWADKVVRESLVLFPEDVYRYYLKNRGEFSKPASVRLVRLRVPIEMPVTTETIAHARQLADGVRLRAVRGGGLEAVLGSDPQYRVDPPGRTFEVVRTQSDLDPQILDRTFQLAPAQISEPIQTKDGFYLVEVKDKSEPPAVSLAEVRPRIDAAIRAKMLPQQFDYLSGREQTESHAASRPRLYDFLPTDADIVRVRDFALTQGEFTRLYPEAIGPARRPNKNAIAAQASEIVTGEVITQDLERKNLLDEPFYQEALGVGKTLFRAADYVHARRGTVKATDEEVAAYLAANRDTIFPAVSKVVWRYEATPTDRDPLRPGEMNSRQILMTSYLQSLITQARQQLRERREIAATTAVIDPQSVLRNLPEPDDTRVKVRFEPVGTLNRRQVGSEMSVSFDELVVGDFTEPKSLRDGSVASYYVTEQVQSPLPEEAVLLEIARAALTSEMAQGEAIQAFQELKKSGQVKYNAALAE